MFDKCPNCDRLWPSANGHADLYLNEAGGCSAVMMDGSTPGQCTACNVLLQPHACPSLHRFEQPSLPPARVTVRMEGVLDVTETHVARVDEREALRMAEYVASTIYTTTTVSVGDPTAKCDYDAGVSFVKVSFVKGDVLVDVEFWVEREDWASVTVQRTGQRGACPIEHIQLPAEVTAHSSRR